jgi:hypothetical protein
MGLAGESGATAIGLEMWMCRIPPRVVRGAVPRGVHAARGDRDHRPGMDARPTGPRDAAKRPIIRILSVRAPPRDD